MATRKQLTIAISVLILGGLIVFVVKPFIDTPPRARRLINEAYFGNRSNLSRVASKWPIDSLAEAEKKFGPPVSINIKSLLVDFGGLWFAEVTVNRGRWITEEAMTSDGTGDHIITLRVMSSKKRSAPSSGSPKYNSNK